MSTKLINSLHWLSLRSISVTTIEQNSSNNSFFFQSYNISSMSAELSDMLLSFAANDNECTENVCVCVRVPIKRKRMRLIEASKIEN